MKKELKKAVEAELLSLIAEALAVRNKSAAAKISKQIKEHVKAITKKFVKNLPETASAKIAKKVTAEPLNGVKPHSEPKAKKKRVTDKK